MRGTGNAYTFLKYITHSDTFAALRRKVSWAVCGQGARTPPAGLLPSRRSLPRTSAWQGYAVCGRLYCGVCERLARALTFEVVRAYRDSTIPTLPVKIVSFVVTRFVSDTWFPLILSNHVCSINKQSPSNMVWEKGVPNIIYKIFTNFFEYSVKFLIAFCKII